MTVAPSMPSPSEREGLRPQSVPLCRDRGIQAPLAGFSAGARGVVVRAAAVTMRAVYAAG